MLKLSHNHWEPLCAFPGAMLDMSGRGNDGKPVIHKHNHSSLASP